MSETITLAAQAGNMLLARSVTLAEDGGNVVNSALSLFSQFAIIGGGL